MEENQTEPITENRKVYYAHYRNGTRYTRFPVIRLAGLFLKDHGFNVGDTLEISFAKNRIVIRKVELKTEEKKNKKRLIN